MGHKFVAKKKRKWKWHYLLYLLLIYFAYQIAYGLFMNLKLNVSNEDFLKALMQDSNHLMIYEQNSKTLVNRFTTFLSNVDFRNPLSILENSFHYKSDMVKEEDGVYNDDYRDEEALKEVTDHIVDPNREEIINPIIYIYNTHQLETYSKTNLESYNITPNVMMASYLLKEKLNKLGVPTIVEENDFTEFMRVNQWTHAYAYNASSFHIKEIQEKKKSVKFFIDLHRDALSKKNSTTTIDGKNYARVLFVVGLEHEGYQANLNLANKMNDMIKKKYPTLTRGVMTKKGPNVDGVYNQNLSPNMILLECGGNENTIDEVNLTLELLAPIIKEIVGDISA